MITSTLLHQPHQGALLTEWVIVTLHSFVRLCRFNIEQIHNHSLSFGTPDDMVVHSKRNGWVCFFFSSFFSGVVLLLRQKVVGSCSSGLSVVLPVFANHSSVNQIQISNLIWKCRRVVSNDLSWQWRMIKRSALWSVTWRPHCSHCAVIICCDSRTSILANHKNCSGLLAAWLTLRAN